MGPSRRERIQRGATLALFGVFLFGWLCPFFMLAGELTHQAQYVDQRSGSHWIDIFYDPVPVWMPLHLAAIGVLLASVAILALLLLLLFLRWLLGVPVSRSSIPLLIGVAAMAIMHLGFLGALGLFVIGMQRIGDVPTDPLVYILNAAFGLVESLLVIALIQDRKRRRRIEPHTPTTCGPHTPETA